MQLSFRIPVTPGLPGSFAYFSAALAGYSMSRMIRRRFLDLPWGQIHFREAGAGDAVPLVLLHSAASSSRLLERLIAAVARTRRVIAPDLPGCGDSTPLPTEGEISVEDMAAWLVSGLDALGIDKADLHGLHLGGRIGVEASLAHPGRVRRLIVDGNGFYDGTLGDEMLARVAPELRPDLDGLYLLTAWHYIRDYFLFFPWFRRDAEHRRPTGLPAPEIVHEKLMEVLRNGRTYSKPYRAAFRYAMERRLPQVTVPVLVAAATDDNVFAYLDRTAALLPHCVKAATPGMATPEAAAETARIFAEFLDAP